MAVIADQKIMADIFLTHAAADARVALLMKEELEKRLPQAKVFCSSDPKDLPPGARWSERIQGELRESRVLLILASGRSIARPWIWFETGFAWGSAKLVIPLCVGDVRKNALPPPLSELQALNIDDSDDLVALINEVSDQIKTAAMPESTALWAARVTEAERHTAIADRSAAGPMQGAARKDIRMLLIALQDAKQALLDFDVDPFLGAAPSLPTDKIAGIIAADVVPLSAGDKLVEARDAYVTLSRLLGRRGAPGMSKQTMIALQEEAIPIRQRALTATDEALRVLGELLA
jgi:hypothetical protein